MFCQVGIVDHKDIGNLDAMQATLCNAVSLKRENHFLVYCHSENERTHDKAQKETFLVVSEMLE
jgi:hypothetical protein